MMDGRIHFSCRSTEVRHPLGWNMTTGCLSTLEDRHPINLKRYMNSKLNYPILIAGFFGPGMVGSISANYIVDKIDSICHPLLQSASCMLPGPNSSSASYTSLYM